MSVHLIHIYRHMTLLHAFTRRAAIKMVVATQRLLHLLPASPRFNALVSADVCGDLVVLDHNWPSDSDSDSDIYFATT